MMKKSKRIKCSNLVIYSNWMRNILHLIYFLIGLHCGLFSSSCIESPMENVSNFLIITSGGKEDIDFIKLRFCFGELLNNLIKWVCVFESLVKLYFRVIRGTRTGPSSEGQDARNIRMCGHNMKMDSCVFQSHSATIRWFHMGFFPHKGLLPLILTFGMKLLLSVPHEIAILHVKSFCFWSAFYFHCYSITWVYKFIIREA